MSVIEPEREIDVGLSSDHPNGPDSGTFERVLNIAENVLNAAAGAGNDLVATPHQLVT